MEMKSNTPNFTTHLDANHLEGYAVVEAKEMMRRERASLKKGGSEEDYMVAVGRKVADQVERFVQKRESSKAVTLLVGKGNNGGDALAAGRFLMQRGYRVVAYHLAESMESHPLCRKQERAFVQGGGHLFRGVIPKLKGVLIDGLLGTGYQGKVSHVLQQVIKQANDSSLPILAIDLPSGVNGNTGEVDPIAIRATETLFLGLPKLGCFIGRGYEHTGTLIPIDFGIDTHALARGSSRGFLIKDAGIPPLLPPIVRTRHKYQAGYLLAISGSCGMAGSAILACLAALRTGAGIVRLFHPKGMEGEWGRAPLELVRTPVSWPMSWEERVSSKDLTSMLKEGKRATGCLIGPGIGKETHVTPWIQTVASSLTVPIVFDADAFFHIQSFPKGSILTPHLGEAQVLFKKTPLSHDACQRFVDANAVTLVLKGAPSWIFHPNTLPLISTRGDPGMASAGTGDVLTGVIGSFLSQGLRGREAAALGVYLHGLAGEIAAKQYTSYSLIASDLIQILPSAFNALLYPSAFPT